MKNIGVSYEKKILKLNPFHSEKIWGYEKWTLSTHKNGHSKIKHSDTNLIDYIREDLPTLKKIIKAVILISIIIANLFISIKEYKSDYKMVFVLACV